MAAWLRQRRKEKNLIGKLYVIANEAKQSKAVERRPLLLMNTKKKQNKIFSFILSIVVSVLLIVWLLSMVEEGTLLDLFRNFYWPAFYFYLLFFLIGFSLRALRYCWLIGPGKVSFKDMLLVTMVRQVFVDLLPMKLGELSYVVLLKKRFQVPVETGFSSMMAVFLFDCISLFPVLLLSLSVVGKTGMEVVSGSFIALTIGMLLLLCLILWKLDLIFGKIAAWLDRYLKKRVLKNPHWLSKVLLKCEKIAEELAHLKARRVYLKTFLISFGIRICKYLSIYSVLIALIQYKGIGVDDMNIFKVVIGLAGAELSSFLPVQGLAGFGTWEAAWALTFQWIGFDRDLAVLTGLGIHLTTQVTEYIVGAFCLVLLWLPWRKNGSLAPPHPEP